MSRSRTAFNLLFTAVCVLVVLAVKLASGPTLGSQTPFLLFSVAVALCAYRFGFRYGVLAGLIAGGLADYFFVGDGWAFATRLDDFVKVASFIFQALVIGWTCSRLHRTCVKVAR